MILESPVMDKIIRMFMLLALAATFFPCVSAEMAVGDAFALIIGLVIAIMGGCACIGAYARKRSGLDSL